MHPHFHLLLICRPSYFSNNYISQQKWVELWQKAAKLDYKPQVYVKAVHKKQNLNKVKALLFAVWEGKSRVTKDQVAEFYEVSIDSLNKNYQRCKDEFDRDGVEVLRGERLREVKDILSLSPSSPKEIIYTAAGVLRMGFILRDSEIAREVRSVTIQMIQGTGKQLDIQEVRSQKSEVRSQKYQLVGD